MNLIYVQEFFGCNKTFYTTVELNFPCDKVDVTRHYVIRIALVYSYALRKSQFLPLLLYLLPCVYHNILLA